MNKSLNLLPRYFLFLLVTIAFYMSTTSSAICEVVVKGKVDVPFETGFFSDEPDDESKEKALEKAKLAAWRKYTSGFKGAKIMSYGKVKKQVLENLNDYVIEITARGFKVMKESKSLRVAGDAMDTALVNYMRKEYNLMIGDSTAEKIKKEIGTAIPSNSNTYAVKGRDLRSGTPKEVNITEEDTAEALNDILKEMVNGIKDALENTPPELSADLVDMGLTLTGGGALLKNIDKRFSKETGLPVFIADDPLSCVAIGTGKALEQEEIFSSMLSEY